MNQSSNQGQGTLLIVDDEARIVDSLKRVLRPLRLDILSASNAKMALDCLEQNDIDIVIADEGLPGVPGTQLLARAKDRYPDVVRIMLTGQLDIDVAKAAINDGGIFRFLTKPTHPAELLAAVDRGLVHRATLRQMSQLLESLHSRQQEMQALEQQARGLTSVSRDSSGVIVLDDLIADMGSIVVEMEKDLDAADRRMREVREGRRLDEEDDLRKSA